MKDQELVFFKKIGKRVACLKAQEKVPEREADFVIESSGS